MKAQILKTQRESEAHTIILIHGLYQNSFIMRTLGKRLEKLHYTVRFFDYATLRKSTSENAHDLLLFLATIQTPYSIIGHSLGCLVTYHAMQQLLKSPVNTVANRNVKCESGSNSPIIPTAIIAITPPFQGVRIVQYLDEIHSAFLVGKAKQTLSSQPETICWEHDIPLGVIAGTNNSGPSAMLLEKITHKVSEDSLQGDGTVYLDEATIPGAQDFITLPKSHTMILFDPSLPTLCDHFIRFGDFGHFSRFKEKTSNS